MTQLRPDISWVWTIKGEVITALQTESILFRSHQIDDRTRQINRVPFKFTLHRKQKCQVFKGKVLACPRRFGYLLMFINVTYLTRTGAQSGAPRGIWKFSESQNWLSLIWAAGLITDQEGIREKISDRAGGGAGPWERFWTILGNYRLIEMQRSNQNCFHSPVMMRDFNYWLPKLLNMQTISFNKKNTTANNCSSIPGQWSNWHLNKLNARSDSMIHNLFWINSGEASIGTGLIL